MNYDLIITSVHDRGDLLARTLQSMLPQLDIPPARILIHEDVRPSHPFVAGRTEALLAPVKRDHPVQIDLMRCNPGGGLGRALLKLLEAAATEFVLYSQEDFDTLRPLPIGDALDVMARHELHHVRFNKRKTMRVKGEDRPPAERWTKQEVTLDGRTLCVSDNWYFQTSLWRRSIALDGFRYIVDRAGQRSISHAEIQFQRWFHAGIGQGAGTTDGAQEARRAHCRTFIWGGIGEPAFIRHTGSDRRSQGWDDPAHDRKFGTVHGERR